MVSFPCWLKYWTFLGQIYYPCHKWLWAQWYSQGVQWAMANMSTKIGDLMSSQMSIKLQVGRSPSVSGRAWEAISPPFKISSSWRLPYCVLDKFMCQFCFTRALHLVRSSESPRMWDQVSLQDLAPMSPSSNERVTNFNCVSSKVE